MSISPHLSENAIKVLERRYLLRDQEGNIVETPDELFRRVAENVASAEERYGGDPGRWEQVFYEVMAGLEFLPNSPTLMNAGTILQQLAACFVLPVPDSLDGIFDAVKHAALIHQSGGGTGFSFSHLRPRGDVVRLTGGLASGPVSFMKVFNEATQAVRQGGRRRGANMAVLRVDHPDIVEFITAKRAPGALTNFNLSVAVTDEFMQAAIQGHTYELINPRTGKPVKELNATEVLDLIAQNGWATGEPGMIFLDQINEANPTPVLGQIESTNPCGEQPLLPYEACNLGSINLNKVIHGDRIDYDHLGYLVDVAVRFLDDVIDVTRYPLPEIERMSRGNRKIGLGVMGFADALIRMRVPYDSEDGLMIAEKIMSFIQNRARDTSVNLAEERGVFPNFEKSIYAEPGMPRVRNATRTTIAPTGTLSVIADCSSGIEPLYAISYVKHVFNKEELVMVNPLFEDVARERGFYTEELMEKVRKTGMVQGFEEVPEDVRRVFVTAHDISPTYHVRMLAAFQHHTDNAVSKTVNFPQDATVRHIRDVFLLAHELGVKGITVYRSGSRKEQVLVAGAEECPDCGAGLTFAESGEVCRVCGYADVEGQRIPRC